MRNTDVLAIKQPECLQHSVGLHIFTTGKTVECASDSICLILDGDVGLKHRELRVLLGEPAIQKQRRNEVNRLFERIR